MQRTRLVSRVTSFARFHGLKQVILLSSVSAIDESCSRPTACRMQCSRLESTYFTYFSDFKNVALYVFYPRGASDARILAAVYVCVCVCVCLHFPKSKNTAFYVFSEHDLERRNGPYLWSIFCVFFTELGSFRGALRKIWVTIYPNVERQKIVAQSI